MANDLELALKIRADLGATRQTLAGLRGDVDKLGKAGSTAGVQMQKGLSGLKGIASQLSTAFAGIGAGIAFGSIIKATVEQEAALAQIEARIKSTGGAAGVTGEQLAKLAGELQNTTTFADDQISAMQATLLVFTNVTGQQFLKANEAILNMATTLGTDLQTAALQVGKALNDPIDGATKLRRAGVDLTDSQEQLIKKLVETGRLAQAQEIILGQLETQFGGAARAARDTFGGALEGLKNAFSDLLEAHQGLPGARDEIEKLSKLLADPQFQASADKITSSLVAGFAELLRILPGVLSQMKELAPLIGTIGGAVAGGRTGTLVGSIFGPQVAAGAGIVGAIVGGVKGFDAGSAVKNFEPPPPPAVDPAKAQADAAAKAAAQAAREKAAAEAAAKRAQADALAAARGASSKAAGKSAAEREADQQKKAIESVIEALQKEAETFGMTSEQIALYNLQKLGASEATIQQATAITDTITKQREEAETIKATEAAIKAEAEARREAKAADDEYLLTLGDEVRLLGLSARERAQDEAVRRLSTEATAEQIEAVRTLSGALYDQQQAAQETTDQMSEFAIQGARNMQTAFADFLFDPFQGGLQGMLEGFINVLRQMTSEALAARIFETIGAEDLFKNVLSFGTNSGADAAAQQAAATAAAAALTTGGATAGTAITTGAVTGATALTASGTATAASIVAGAKTAAAILAAASAGGSGGAGGILSGLFHSGGIVGSGGAARMMPAIAFANAPRYHSGGIAGLAADELPAVLRRNEEVLTRNDPRHRYNGGGQQAVTLKNINLFDTQVIGDYLATGEGEKVVLNIVSRNRNVLR